MCNPVVVRHGSEFDGAVYNDKIEKMNGEVRDWKRRCVKLMDAPILKATRIYHTFIKPHEGLNGKTPDEAAGIKVEGDDKWLTLIQNSSKRN